MRFNVTLIDPPTYKYAYTLTDLCRAVAGGLRSLGHSADLTVNAIDGDSTNIIFGSHLLSADDLTGIVNSGVRYIPVHTEWLQPYDNGSIGNQFHRANFWPMFGRFFERADAVWDSFESNFQNFERLGIPRSKLKRLWLGYHPELEDICHRPAEAKDIDALFFGSMTPRRASIIEPLRQHLRVVNVMDAPAAFRNDLIARTKLNLVVHSLDELQYCSFIRIGYVSNNRGAIVSEPWQGDADMRPLVVESSAATFLETCQDLVSSNAYARRAQEAYEQYRGMPMTRILEPIIE